MILTENVNIKISNRQSKYYRNLFYDFNIGDTIKVKIKDLPISSREIILAKCDYCGNNKEVSFKNYNNYTKDNKKFACSKKCSKIKIEETNLERYGVKNPFQSEYIKDKIKETNIERYGVENYTKTDEFKLKSKLSNLEKYGYESYSKTNEFKDFLSNKLDYSEIFKKVKETNLEKYGVENYSQTIDFKKKIKEINFNKFSEKIRYYGELVDSKPNVYTIKCKDCGSIFEILHTLLYTRRDSGDNICTSCNPKKQTLSEDDLFKFINDNIQSIPNDRTILNGKEIDIYIPSRKIGIEYNGLYWHSEIYKEDKYHLNKTELCNSKGIQLIHIFEDEWLYKKEIVKSRLLNLLGKSEKIYARKCEIKEIVDNKEVREFLDKNHIQGFVGSKVKLGLFYNNELVSIMTFGNLRKNLGQNSKEGSYELLRFCNNLNTSVVGGASRLFKYFLKTYKPDYILSYADRRWSKGDLYKNLGFEFTHNTKPSWSYPINGIRINRYSFRKDILIKEGYDKSKSSRQIMLDRGYYRVYDCGVSKWEFNI